MTKGLPFSAEDICAILDRCHERGVAQLKIGTFEASFHPPEPKAPSVVTPTPEEIALARKYEADTFKDLEVRIKREEMAQLRVNDPEMFEELINRGEFLDAGEESDGANT